MRTTRKARCWMGAVVVILLLVPLTIAGCGNDESDTKITAVTDQEKIVADFLTAMENKDVDAVFEMIDMASLVGELPEEQMELAKDQIAAEIFDYESVDFSGIKMKTEETGSTAVVTLTEGTITAVDTAGSEETLVISEADEPMEFQLVQDSGEWRLAFMSGL